MLINTMPKPSRKTTTAKSPKPTPAANTTAPSAAATALLDPVFAVVARYFGVLSEPTRLKILHTICQDERSVSAIVAATGATQTNVSRHLALMLAAGVVSRRRAGNVVFYRVAEPEFVDICRTVCVQIASRIDGQKPLKQDLLQFAAQH
jgi:DNA-binding transcriptional ArsR family regulator